MLPKLRILKTKSNFKNFRGLEVKNLKKKGYHEYHYSHILDLMIVDGELTSWWEDHIINDPATLYKIDKALRKSINRSRKWNDPAIESAKRAISVDDNSSEETPQECSDALLLIVARPYLA
jgi:hypothetical protein